MSGTTDYDEDDEQQIAPQSWGRPPRPPSGIWPPCPPGRPGPWPSGLFRLEQCWEDVKATKRFLRRMIADIIAEDPSLVGLSQPIIGVTDGAEVQPGFVGEYIQLGVNAPFPAGQFGPLQAPATGVLQPGDWDYWAYATWYPTQASAMEFLLNPMPSGFSNPLNTYFIAAGMTESGSLVSTTGRALIAAPSLITFQIGGNAQTAGEMNVTFCARRRR